MSTSTLEQTYRATDAPRRRDADWVRVKADGKSWVEVVIGGEPSRDPSVRDISAVFDDVGFSDEESDEIDAILAQGGARLTVPSLRLGEIE